MMQRLFFLRDFLQKQRNTAKLKAENERFLHEEKLYLKEHTKNEGKTCVIRRLLRFSC